MTIPNAPRCAVSVDVDSVASHLRGYGFSDSQDIASVYEMAIPRLLSLFERMNISGTFFFVAAEAAEYRDILEKVVSAGHEIACHSMTHTVGADYADPAVVKCELREARVLLEAVSGTRVVGFRAPRYELSPALLRGLIESGFDYDASAFPSWAYALLQWQIRRRSQSGPGSSYFPSWLELWSNAGPHVRSEAGGTIVEIPLATTPIIRLPVYHTLRYLLPDPVFHAWGMALRARRREISYVAHAIDVLGYDDPVDGRVLRHPGMRWSSDQKVSGLQQTLSRLLHQRTAVPLCRIAQACRVASGGS